MARKFALALSLMIVMSCAASAQDVKTVLNNASKAMGAQNLKTIQFSGSGSTFALGQALNPNVGWPRFNADSYTYTVDYGSASARQEMVRSQALNPPLGGGAQPAIGHQRGIQFVSGNYAWAVNGQDKVVTEPSGNGLNSDPVGDRSVQIWLTPHGFLKGAMMSPAATVKQETIGGKHYEVVSFPGANKAKINGYINDQNLVEKTETWVDNSILGDMPIGTTFSGYKDFGGVKFPTKIVQKQGGWPTLDLTITDVKPNTTADFTVPDVVRKFTPPPLVKLTTQKVADGIYFFSGQNDNSIAVEFKDFVVMIEGPMSEERSLAVMAETSRLIPNKPIRYLVNTHAHFDHTGGVRTYAAKGITIITQRGNKAYFDNVVLKGPHTIHPDLLSMTKITPKVEAVDDSREITDGSRKIVLYHFHDNRHADAMLMVWFPAEKMLIEGDVFTVGLSPLVPPVPPPGAPADFPRCCEARNFYDNVQRLHLDVKTLLPIHNDPAPWPVFLAYLGKKPGEN